MMNGTLETRKEEDAIFTDLVMPEWMSEKPEDELTDDDRAAIKEFQDAQKKLQAERDKRSKGLLTELAKLRLEIQDICNNFNERVKALKETKIQFDSALYESELIVIRLAQARLQFEAFERHSAELTKELAEQASVAADARSKLAIFNVELNKQAELVEALGAEDRALEKAFKKDFAEVPDFFEALNKLFKRRETIKVPLGTKDGSKGQEGQGAGAAAGRGAADRRRVGRPTAATTAAAQAAPTWRRRGARPYADLDEPEMEDMVEALDPAIDMPEGLSFDVWDKLVEARNAKLRSEDQLAEATKTLEAMQEYQQLLAADDNRCAAASRCWSRRWPSARRSSCAARGTSSCPSS